MTGDMWTITTALTDSLLVRWLLLLAAVCALIYIAMTALYRLDRRLEERRRVRDLARYQRAQANWEAHIAAALRACETPIHEALTREQFIADAQAEIDELTGGASA